MPEQETLEKATSKPSKCAHLSCKCPVPEARPFGDFCGDYCIEAAHQDPVVCQCGHIDCQEIAPRGSKNSE